MFHDRLKLIEVHKSIQEGKSAIKMSAMEFQRFIEGQLKKHRFRQMRCRQCKKDLSITLDGYAYSRKYYCPDHCPEHKWQAWIDSGPECAHCGIDYDEYLENLLEENNISFTKYKSE